MKFFCFAIPLLISTCQLTAQKADTFLLKKALSKTDTVIYKRIISGGTKGKPFRVRDFYENGQIQMDAHYSSFNRNIKEGLQCNYRSNTKEGQYSEWYGNGQQAYTCRFKAGVRNGFSSEWDENGRIISTENWLNGQLHGLAKYWSSDGKLVFSAKFDHGENLQKKDVTYRYLKHLPDGYESDTLRKWPLIIFLHGGSGRGNDLNKVYDNGIPDQIWRGRKFPFIVVSPQCPAHLRWTTDNWFENLFDDIIKNNRVDTDRVYLTGLSLGAEGVWYLAAKYPEKFAAIAPVSGFTSLTPVIEENIENLYSMPVWAFHSESDDVVPFEETQRIIKMLQVKNKSLQFSTEPDNGHWMHWSVYSGTDLYNWLLNHRISDRKE